MKSPTELTKEFTKDFKEWNDLAFSLSRSEAEGYDYAIRKGYDDLILKFCGPEKKYQGPAYGSRSSHCPDQERVLSESVESSSAIVRTKFTDRDFDHISHDHEYHFVRAQEEWALEEVYLVDSDGKWKLL